ncbi:MAG: TonB-dependent receptor [Bacteroidota bacterium]|nr:TonB-dependent receptor [Bacteroidota bacterium]
MKLTITLLLFAVIAATAGSTYSQSARINLKMQDASLVDVFREIERTSEFGFFFKSEEIDLTRRVSIDLKNVSIEEVLKKILMDNYDYRILDKNIVVTRGSFNTTDVQVQQGKSVSGKVTDSSGAPLPGVSVVVKGTTNGTITDGNGNYSLPNVTDNAVLQFSFVGMKTQEFAIGGKSTINVILADDAIGIEEVVAIGYGTIKKSDITGAVSSVKSEDLISEMNQSIDKALSGKVAGVQVTQISGAPGSGATIRIRGANSIMASNEPLYVIDGIPLTGGGGAGGLSVGEDAGISGLSHINPSDIQSIEILKDASSTAIYGSRGANGVVLITTKRGTSNDKATITYDTYYGIQQIEKKIELTNATQYGELMNEYFKYIKQTPLYPDPAALGIGTNWQDLLYRTGSVKNHSLSFNGGNKNTQYLVSVGYMDIEGIVENSYFDRYTLRANIDSELTKWFKVGNSISVVRTTGNVTETAATNNTDVIGSTLAARPTSQNMVDGVYTLYIDENGLDSNPIARAKEITNYDIRNRVLGNVYGEISIIKGLKLKTILGYDITDSKANYYAPKTVSIGKEKNGSAKVGTSNSIYWNNTNTLTYSKEFSIDHRLTLLGGVTWEKNYTETTRVEASNFVTDALLFNNVSSGTLQQTFSGANDWSLHSYLGRANYSLMNKYLFTFTGRIDGSSRFGANNKYAFFPSAAFAWRINEENFLSENKWISNLKMRFSVGSAGEQGIPSYQSLAVLSSVQVPLGSSVLTGYTPNRMANPDLRWERTNQSNIGIDFGILDNRLSFTIDAYYKKTQDLLFEIEIPKISGYATTLLNVGSIANKGIEFLANVVPVDKAIKWDFTLNLSLNRNKVLKLSDGLEEIISPLNSVVSSDLKSNPSIIRVGEPIGTFYGYVFDGIFQNADEVAKLSQTGAAPGELRFKDISGPEGVPDGKITPLDKQIIGDANPDLTGGIINHISYKRFDLNANFQWTIGGSIYNYQQMYLTNANLRRNFTKDFYDNRWTEENPNNHTPRSGYNPRTFPDNNYFIYDASYFRCKNITFSYDIPTNKNRIIQKANIYFSADNLFTLTDYPGYNPDASAFGNRNLGSGVDIGVYPSSKTYRIGLNIQF